METESSLEKKLSMPRAKPRSLAVSIAYRIMSIARPVFGKESLLRFSLNGAWLFWHFAFELSGEHYSGKFHNHAKALNEEFLKRWIPEEGTVIDIGCGIGRWCLISSKYAKSVVGIDYDGNLIAKARKDASAPNIEYIIGDVTKDLDGRRFDLALLTHVIEHIENADVILKELHEVCSTLIVEVPDFDHDPLNWVRLDQNCRFYSDADHVREYTEGILIEQLKRNDWEILELRKHGGSVLAVARSAQNM